MMEVINSLMAAVGYFTVFTCIWFFGILGYSIHAFGSGPVGIGRLFCIW